MMTFEDVWKSMIALQGDHVFRTARGLPYTFTISGGVIKLSRKANPITKATVEFAYSTASELHGAVPGPKALRCFEASYLYPIFVEIGVIDSKSSKIRTMWMNTRIRRKKLASNSLSVKQSSFRTA